MMTALLTAKNIMLGRREFDVWCVNQDAEYHEEGEAGAEQAVADKSAAILTARTTRPNARVRLEQPYRHSKDCAAVVR